MTSSSRSVRSFAGGRPIPVPPVSDRVLVFQIWFAKSSETAKAVNAGFDAHANPAVEFADTDGVEEGGRGLGTKRPGSTRPSREARSSDGSGVVSPLSRAAPIDTRGHRT